MTMYFADDKDVRDLLDTSKQKLTAEILREFLLRRGMLVSTEATKLELFNQISMWTLDWEELQWLLDKTARSDRSERYTSAVVPGKFSAPEVRKAVEALKQSPNGVKLDSINAAQTLAGTITVTVTYSELDPAKTRLRQKRVRDGSLTLEVNGDAVTLRHEANERMGGVAEDLVKALSSVKGEEVTTRKIELTHLTNLESRTQFFLNLIKEVKGISLSDVSKVQVERSVSPADMPGATSSDQEDDDDLIQEDEQLELVGNQVRGAILRGVSLLTSPEFQMLKKGFFLCGMEWMGQEAGEKGRLVQFEAAFEDPQACKGFRYKVKGVIERKKAGDGEEFVKTARSCTELENLHFVQLLEDASRGALDAVEKTSVADTSAANQGAHAKGGTL